MCSDGCLGRSGDLEKACLIRHKDRVNGEREERPKSMRRGKDMRDMEEVGGGSGLDYQARSLLLVWEGRRLNMQLTDNKEVMCMYKKHQQAKVTIGDGKVLMHLIEREIVEILTSMAHRPEHGCQLRDMVLR
jgi:hypothetical protein